MTTVVTHCALRAGNVTALNLLNEGTDPEFVVRVTVSNINYSVL